MKTPNPPLGRAALAATLLLGHLAAGAEAPSPGESLVTIRERFVRSVLPAAPADVERVHALAARHAGSVGDDGQWPDLRYDEDDRAHWSGGSHLGRTLLMAKSARLRRDAGAADPELTARAVAALRAWTGPDPQNPNWWWNRIGVPELVGEIACLLYPDLPPDQLSAAVRILRRSETETMTGANLTWCAINQVILGCLAGSEDVTREAYDRLYQEVRFADDASGREGIQPDFSFHQHGPQLSSGGYGLFFANDVGRFVYVAHGTPFQIPDDRRAVFDAYVLDGLRWATWGDVLDYSTIGRIIVRAGVVAVPTDWSLGPISPAGPAYSLGNVVRLLAELPGPRQGEYAAYAADLAEAPGAAPFEGNKHFWSSDYMAHRRRGYLATVKMYSTRTRNGEIVNGEGRKSHHLSAGANFLYVTGEEYKDVFPAWDWQKVPGTTAEQVGAGTAGEMNAIEQPNPVGAFGKSAFVGGASDGRYGLCAMDLRRGALSARKAWFFFDGAYACLGNGITLDNDRAAVTAVNQVHLRGDVRTAASPSPLAGDGTHDLTGVAWVHHDRIGYVFVGDDAPVRVSRGNQTGRWSDFGGGSSQPVTLPVFSAWIDHGRSPRDAAYAYVVLPGASAEETAAYAARLSSPESRDPHLRVLANDADGQAVADEESKRVGAVFRRPGQVQTPYGTLGVDYPCLVLLTVTPTGATATVADPEGRPATVRVTLDAAAASVALPTGPDAGASATSELK